MDMLIRFDNGRVRVMTTDGPSSVDLSAKYEEVAVEFVSLDGFWHRLARPLSRIRAAALLDAAVLLLSEGTRDDKVKTDDL